MKKKNRKLIFFIIIATIIACGLFFNKNVEPNKQQTCKTEETIFYSYIKETNSEKDKEVFEVENKNEILPEFSGSIYSIINNNIPYFTEEEITTNSFEKYSELDSLGRCGVAFACIGTDIMPTEERGEIGHIKPSGWHTVKYNEIVEGNYLYNRCHLIAFQLAGENANEKNLITGTRYFNVEGMLPFENTVAEYVRETKNHVMYRVTPVFDGNNLVASGVLMEALSVEDNGKGIQFNVFVYNIQPGISIDYSTGDSWINENVEENYSSVEENIVVNDYKRNDVKIADTTTYVCNTNSMKFHKIHCESVSDINEKNLLQSEKSKEELLEQGYMPCKRCNP